MFTTRNNNQPSMFRLPLALGVATLVLAVLHTVPLVSLDADITIRSTRNEGLVQNYFSEMDLKLPRGSELAVTLHRDITLHLTGQDGPPIRRVLRPAAVSGATLLLSARATESVLAPGKYPGTVHLVLRSWLVMVFGAAAAATALRALLAQASPIYALLRSTGKETRPQTTFYKFSLVHGLLALGSLLPLLLLAGRGVHQGDESALLICSLSPLDHPVLHTCQYLINMLGSVVPLSLLSLRHVSLASALAGALVLGISLQTYMRSKGETFAAPWLGVVPFTITGALLAHSQSVFTFSYNELAALFVNLSLGLALQLAAGRPIPLRATLMGLAFAGLTIAKVSSAPPLFLVLAAFLFHQLRSAAFLRVLALGTGGVCAGFLTFFLAYPPSAVLGGVVANLQYFSTTALWAYSSAGAFNALRLLGINLAFCLMVAAAPAYFLALSRLPGAVHAPTERRLDLFAALSFLAGLFSVQFLLLPIQPFQFAAAGNSFCTPNFHSTFLYAALLLSFGLAAFMASRIGPGQAQAPAFSLLGIVLFLAPLCGAFGTNERSLLSGAGYHAAAWFTLLFLLVARRSSTPRWQSAGCWLLVFIHAIAVVQITEGALLMPRNSAPAWEQTVPLDALPGGRGLYTTKQEARTILGAWETLRNTTDYTPGDVIIAAYSLPTLVALYGGTSPGEAWYRDPLPESIGLFKMKIARVSPDFRQAFVLLNMPLPDNLLAVFREQGMRFPEDYVFLGSFPGIPLVCDGGYFDHPVNIYAPRSRTRSQSATEPASEHLPNSAAERNSPPTLPGG